MSNVRPIPAVAVDFVKRLEACRLSAYRDVGGVWTIGYGHTGPEVIASLSIDQARADADLWSDLAVAAGRLAGVVQAPVLLDLTDNQYAALLSFVFNLGCQPGWTIWKVLNARAFDQVPAQISRFVNAGGVKVQGLVNRRAQEVVLWSTEEPGSIPDVPSSAVTRAARTPPTPEPVKPLGRQKSFVATAVTASVAVAAPFVQNAQGAVTAINTTIAPYVGASVILQHLAESLSIGLAGLSVVSLFLVWLKNHQARTQ
ncbi:MAG TPA: lysozyme [Caulobacteraceae bacterium]|nr:lysozyme [Caulobacteraceae bacterium]